MFNSNQKELIRQGRLKMDMARQQMPVLQKLKSIHSINEPLKGIRIAGCLHMTKETAILIESLIEAGATVAWCGCNPLSTQDDIVAALIEKGINIYAKNGMDRNQFYTSIHKTLDIKPHITLDDGGDLVFTVHQERRELLNNILGGTEETTTGVQRLQIMAKCNKLDYPIIAVNNSITKWDFDNVYGTGQSAIDGIIRATATLIANKIVVVAGYGHCGQGIAMRARGMGAQIIITEVSSIMALKAALNGYMVMPMDQACQHGDIFITATGMKDIIRKNHFELMKNHAIICNAGHYDCEINIPQLISISKHHRCVRQNNTEYTLNNNRRLYLLGEGRLVNLVCAEGHPSEVMDMSFANQFLAILKLVSEYKIMSKDVHLLPKEVDDQIALLKLECMGLAIDKLSSEQIKYQNSYHEGT